METPPPDRVRSATDVARRALALFGVVGLALGAPPDALRAWLDDNGLQAELTPRERGFVDAAEPPPRDRIDFSWQSERLLVLLWALGKVDALPPATEQCDTARFQDLLPPFADVGVADFVAQAKLRPDVVLCDMADTLLDLHWHARDGRINGRPPGKPVDMEIVQERHHAINWITGYCGLPWDEVTTDT